MVWWAVSGRGEKPTANQTPPARPGSTGVAKAVISPSRLPEGVVPPEKAAQYLHQRCTVEMKVMYVGKATTTDRYFLNSKVTFRDNDNFTITFTKAVIDQLKARGVTDISAHFERRTIRVSGTVTEFQTRPQIEIDDLDRIHFVDSGT